MATSKSAASALFLVLVLILCLGAGTSPSVAAELTAADKRLFDAVWANDMATVRRVLAEGADPAAADENGMSAVDVAVDRGYFEIAHYLLAVQNQRRITPGSPPAQPAAPPAAAPMQPPAAPAPAPAPASVVVTAPIEPSPASPAASTEPATTTEPAAPAAQQAATVDPALPDFLTKEKVEFINPDEFLKGETAASSDAAASAVPTAPADAASSEAATGETAAVRPASPTSLPPAEAETPNLFQRFTNLFGSDDEQTSSSTVTQDPEPAPQQEVTPPREESFLVRRKSARRPEPVPATDGDSQPAPATPAAVIEEDQAAKSPQPAPEAVTSPTPEEMANADADQPAPVVEPESTPSPPLAMQEDNRSSAPAPAPSTNTGQLGQSEEGSFFDKITDFLKTNLEPDPEPAAQAGSSAPDVAATNSETTKPAVETAPQESTTADPAESVTSPAVEKAEAPKTAVIAESAAGPAPAESAEVPDTDLAAEATKSLNEGLADLGEMFGKVGDFFTEGIMGNPKLPPSTVTAENAGITKKSKLTDDDEDGAGKSETGPARSGAPAPAARKQPSQELPSPRPASPEVAARTGGEMPASQRLSEPPQPASGPAQPVRAVGAQDMVLGSTGWLGKRLIYDEAAAAACVEKAAWKSRFCIEDIDWPESMQSVFRGSRGVFGAGKAIVRYIGGVASQYHVVFPTQAYNQVAAHFTDRFGPPHETPDVWATLLGEPKRFNNTVRWYAKDISGPGMVLEIREIDDLRWSAPPDVKSGVVRLHHKGAGTVFEHLTTADLLLIQVQKGGQSAVAAPDVPTGSRAKPQ